jgi:hypothetical protein
MHGYFASGGVSAVAIAAAVGYAGRCPRGDGAAPLLLKRVIDVSTIGLPPLGP